MRRFAVLFAFLSVSVQAASPEATLLRATALLKRPLPAGAEQHRRAYALLEEMVVPTSDDRLTRSSEVGTTFLAAQILALAPGKALTKRGRHDYAEIALKNQGLSAVDRDALLRIAADGAFDAAQLPRARRFYDELGHSELPESADYAAYKLGWIDLNEGNPMSAWDRWMGRLQAATSVLLTDSITRDLARAWAEMQETDSVRDLARAKIVGAWLDTLSRSDRARALSKLADGWTMGLRRAKDAQVFEAFRKHLVAWRQLGSHWKDQHDVVFARLVAQNIGFSKFPCTLSGWMADAAPETIDGFDVRNLGAVLNTCMDSESYKKNGEARAALQAQIAQAIAQLPTRGIGHDVRAQLFEKASLVAQACQENLDSLPRGESKQDAEVLSEAYRVCTQTQPMASHWSGLLRVGAALGDRTETALPALAARWANSASGAKALARGVLGDAGAFQGSALAVVALDGLKKVDETERAALEVEMLDRLAPAPMNSAHPGAGIWLACLREHLTEARLLRHLPLDRGVLNWEPARALWLRWALGPEVKSDTASSATALRLAIALSERGTAGGATAITVEEIALELKLGRESTPRLTRRLAKSWPRDLALEIQSALASRMWELKTEIPDFSGEGAGLSACLREARTGIAETKYPEACASRFSSLDQSKRPGFVRDWDALRARGLLGASIGKPLRFNAGLARKLELELARLKSDLEWTRSRLWSDARLARMAQVRALERCDVWVDGLKRIELPRALSTADRVQAEQVLSGVIENVSGVVEGWKRQSLGALPEIQTSSEGWAS